MKNKTLWIGGGVLLAAVLGAMGWEAWRGIAVMQAAKADPRALVRPVTLLADYGVEPACGDRCEHFKARQDGATYTISYEYDDTDGESDPLYVSSEALVDWSAFEAAQTFWAYRGGFHLGLLGSGDVTLAEVADNPMTLGDRRYWARIRNGERTVGDMVLVQQGRMVLVYVIVGVHFEAAEDLEELVRPVVAKAAALQAS